MTWRVASTSSRRTPRTSASSTSDESALRGCRSGSLTARSLTDSSSARPSRSSLHERRAATRRRRPGPEPRRRRRRAQPGSRHDVRNDRADRDPTGDGAVLPGLRHVGHRGEGAARRPRRAEARPSSHPLGDARGRPASRPEPPQVRHRRGRRARQVPPARRPVGVRRPGADGPGLLAAPPARRPPRELRLAVRPAGRLPLHGVPADRTGDAHARRDRRGHGRLRRRTSTAPTRSRRSCPDGSPTCWSTAARASRWAWPRTSRPTTSAR